MHPVFLMATMLVLNFDLFDACMNASLFARLYCDPTGHVGGTFRTLQRIFEQEGFRGLWKVRHSGAAISRMHLTLLCLGSCCCARTGPFSDAVKDLPVRSYQLHGVRAVQKGKGVSNALQDVHLQLSFTQCSIALHAACCWYRS